MATPANSTPAPSRRGFIRGFGLLSAIGGASAAPLIVSAAAPEPDADLLAAEREWKAASAALAEAEERYRTASGNETREIGQCPEALRIGDDYSLAQLVNTRKTRLGWATWDGPEGPEMWQIWTSASLRAAIAEAPAKLGRAGRTPHVIRRLRSLLPLAEEREAATRRATAKYGSRDLFEQVERLMERRDELEKRIIELPAATMAGAGVKARFASSWLERMRTERTYDLRQPEPMMAVPRAVLEASSAA